MQDTVLLRQVCHKGAGLFYVLGRVHHGDGDRTGFQHGQVVAAVAEGNAVLYGCAQGLCGLGNGPALGKVQGNALPAAG